MGWALLMERRRWRRVWWWFNVDRYEMRLPGESKQFASKVERTQCRVFIIVQYDIKRSWRKIFNWHQELGKIKLFSMFWKMLNHEKGSGMTMGGQNTIEPLSIIFLSCLVTMHAGKHFLPERLLPAYVDVEQSSEARPFLFALVI